MRSLSAAGAVVWLLPGKKTVSQYHVKCAYNQKMSFYDIGVVVDHYHSDMTRIVFFEEPHLRLSYLYQIVKQAQKAVLDLCAPGITLAELDLAAREVFKKHDLEPFFVHSLGHGSGLKTHEFPRISHQGKEAQVVLQKNMVVTIEPGFIYQILVVRYEDMVLITEGRISFLLFH